MLDVTLVSLSPGSRFGEREADECAVGREALRTAGEPREMPVLFWKVTDIGRTSVARGSHSGGNVRRPDRVFRNPIAGHKADERASESRFLEGRKSGDDGKIPQFETARLTG